MRIERDTRSLHRTLTLALLGGSRTPDVTGRILRSQGQRLTVAVASNIPSGSLFRADDGEMALLGEVAGCHPHEDGFEASLTVHYTVPKARRTPAGLPESLLPDLLALNSHLLEARPPVAPPGHPGLSTRRL